MNKDTDLIKAVIGSTTTEQTEMGNYPMTTETMNRPAQKNPMHTDPMEQNTYGPYYNKSKTRWSQPLTDKGA